MQHFVYIMHVGFVCRFCMYTYDLYNRCSYVSADWLRSQKVQSASAGSAVMLFFPSKPFQTVLVHNSLPYGTDNGSTPPMEVSPGTTPSSVVEILEGEDKRVKDSADPG